MGTRTEGPGFASTSLPRHLVRGVVGFGSLTGCFVLLPLVGPISLLLLPIGALALRGCPMCWTVGLVQTLSRGRLQRSCKSGQCKVEPGDRAATAVAAARPGRAS
ncbi:hypothetical protein ACFW4X_33195 [Streptomyces smyrnaeus]|uniref:DUF2892 domain-containing protein n=1 Tax=Streptomyces smyrnaeus TaxID=1387713 RepID=A0ABS3Y5N7_9ACTN|nr:hypothetical protein [Streptomyces smyrnaeus]MBO8202980.1 hypothetical protein [Streptomyces smyrnaeus]